MQRCADQIRRYIAQRMLFTNDPYPFADDDSLLQEGIVDSMNVMELVAFVEQTFAISVEDDEIVPDHFDSVSKLAAYVSRKLSPHAATADGASRQPAARGRQDDIRPLEPTWVPGTAN